MAKSRSQLIIDSQNRYTSAPNSITPQKHKDSDQDLVDAMEHVLEGAVLVAAADANSDQLFFDKSKGYVHGSNSLPLSGNLAVDMTGALAGAGVIVFHNDSVAPNITGAVKRGYTYTVGVTNILLFVNIAGFVVVGTLAGSGEPYATNVAYDNTAPQSNSPVTLNYTFNDPENDLEGTTLFQHYIETSIGSGVYQAIPGATQQTYIPTVAQVGLKMEGEVIVVSQNAPFQGQPVRTLPTDPIAQGAFLPTDLPSLVTWADLSDISTVNYSGSPETIDSVDDKSGNTNFWNYSGLPPFYDVVNKWIVFDGAGRVFKVSSTKNLNINSGDPRTFFMVFSGDTPGPTEHYGIFVVDGFNNKYTLHHKTNGLGVRNGTTTHYYFAAQSALLFDGGFHVLGIRCSSGNGIRLQFDSHIESDPGNAPFLFPMNDPSYGRTSLSVQGKVAEILICNADLSDTDFSDVFSYLQTKHGL